MRIMQLRAVNYATPSTASDTRKINLFFSCKYSSPARARNSGRMNFLCSPLKDWWVRLPEQQLLFLNFPVFAGNKVNLLFCSFYGVFCFNKKWPLFIQTVFKPPFVFIKNLSVHSILHELWIINQIYNLNMTLRFWKANVFQTSVKRFFTKFQIWVPVPDFFCFFETTECTKFSFPQNWKFSFLWSGASLFVM